MFPINSKNSFSERVDIPNCLAFSSFDPEFSPATRYVVVFVIEFFVCPPALSTIVLALFLFIRFSEPVNTNISPSKELEEDFFICSITTPLSMQLFTMVKLFLSFQNSTMDFATILPISFISNSSLSLAFINVFRSLLYFFSNIVFKLNDLEVDEDSYQSYLSLDELYKIPLIKSIIDKDYPELI